MGEFNSFGNLTTRTSFSCLRSSCWLPMTPVGKKYYGLLYNRLCARARSKIIQDKVTSMKLKMQIGYRRKDDEGLVQE